MLTNVNFLALCYDTNDNLAELDGFIKEYYNDSGVTLGNFIPGDSVTVYCSDGFVTLLYTTQDTKGFSIKVHQEKKEISTT